MKTSYADLANQLVVRRTYSASMERVFRAWTDPKQIVQWMSPMEGIWTESAEIDLRLGGRYRLGYRTPKGLAVVRGEFLTVMIPEKLVYTWTWDESNEHSGAETQVTVEFIDLGAGTELVLTHERFPNQKMRDAHEHGWTGILQNLVAFVGRS
jgi:uncharacterized protein YndB with AHSA1/START domain